MDTVDSFKNVKPYRATKLWNELVVTFKSKLTTQNHRYRMKVYENTFTGTEGVDWILRYLRNHDEFGPDISRQQAIQLLQKFATCRIIEDVTNKKKSNEFQDGKKLYRVVSSSSQSPFKVQGRTPLRAVTQNQQNSNDQSLVLKGNTAVKPPTLTFQLNFDPKVHNECPRPSSAIIEGNALHFPSMPITLSAKEITDIWKNVTWNKLELAVGIATLQDFLNPADICGKTVRHNATRIDKNGIVTVMDKTENLPEWILCAMKCLARWPNASGSASCLPKYEGFENDVFRVVKDHFCNSDIPLIPFDLFRLFYAAYFFIAKTKPNKEISTQNKPKISNSFWEENTGTNEMQFETEFIAPVPVTRLMPSFERSLSSPHSRSRPNSATGLTRKESLLSENKFTRRRRCASMECVNKGRTGSVASRATLDSKFKASLGNLWTEGSNPNLVHFLSEESLISDVVVNKAGGQDDVFNQNDNSLVRRMFVPKTLPSFYRDLNSSCQERFIKFLQLALLLLPMGQRKQLHLLLRLLKKIIDNKQLLLFPPGCVQFMLVKTFASSIIRPKVISGQDDEVVFSCKIADFLVDHCQEVFSPPKELISEVEDILKQQAAAKYTRWQSEPSITYCQRVSTKVYEEQKAQTSTQAISELLESIINNPRLSTKEKQKKLKMFKLQYPEIYERRFPTQSWYELEMAQNERKERERRNAKWTLLEKFLKMRL